MQFISGVLKCGCCDSTYIRRTWHSKSENEKLVWTCTKKIKYGRTKCADSESISEDVLKKSFIQAYSLVVHNNKEIIDNLIKVVDDVLKEENDLSVIKSKENESDEIKKKMINY